MLLMSSSRASWICARTLPSAANAMRLGEILACADDRAANGDALQHHLEDRRREVARRQADETDGAAASVMCSACAKAGGDTAVTSTPCAPPPVAFSHLLHRVGPCAFTATSAPRVRANASLSLGDVERHDMKAHRLGVLDRDMAEAADAGDRHPFAWPRLGLLQSFVGGDARTQNRCERGEVGLFGQASDIGRRTDRVLGEAAIDAVAAIVLLLRTASPSPSCSARRRRTHRAARRCRQDRLPSGWSHPDRPRRRCRRLRGRE